MSHKVTQKSEMTDLNLAIRACNDAGYSYNVDGANLRFTSGPLSRATLNTATGDVVGDTDWHSQGALGKFRQNYARASVLHTCEQQGVAIEGEHKEGNNLVIYTYLA